MARYILVALLLLASTPKLISGAAGQTNTKFIRSSCSATAYPALCYSSLSSYASTIQASPTQLAQAAVSVTLTGARSAEAELRQMAAPPGGRRAGPAMSSRVAAAVADCVETVGDSVAELQDSLAVMGHLGGRDVGFQINSIQTWVSAALTDDDTCMDGFEGRAMDGSVKNEVRTRVTNVAQLTSNALAIINRLVNSAP